jgi:hypothetical protein
MIKVFICHELIQVPLVYQEEDSLGRVVPRGPIIHFDNIIFNRGRSRLYGVSIIKVLRLDSSSSSGHHGPSCAGCVKRP